MASGKEAISGDASDKQRKQETHKLFEDVRDAVILGSLAFKPCDCSAD
jgi:hypothetical protein